MELSPPVSVAVAGWLLIVVLLVPDARWRGSGGRRPYFIDKGASVKPFFLGVTALMFLLAVAQAVF
jgi:hypothetical protein